MDEGDPVNVFGLVLETVVNDGMAMALSCASSAWVRRVNGLVVMDAVGVDQASGVE